MRQALKFLHTLASCGLIGGLACYAVILLYAPQDSAVAFADVRQTIRAIANYILLPSLALALVSGLLSMAVHTPFQEMRWAWIKALLGLGMFEATLGITGSKADYAAKVSAEIANGAAKTSELQTALASEWNSLFAILALSLANVVLGIWRPRLAKRPSTVDAH